jgi:hypothetical protein
METPHFPSSGLPCPDEGCKFQVCAECARSGGGRVGLTRSHFSTDGICTFGHRLELPLADRLTEWIKTEGIQGHYPPDQIAARVVEQVYNGYLVIWLDRGGTDYLRDLCARIKDEHDLTDAEHAAELNDRY